MKSLLMYANYVIKQHNNTSFRMSKLSRQCLLSIVECMGGPYMSLEMRAACRHFSSAVPQPKHTSAESLLIHASAVGDKLLCDFAIRSEPTMDTLPGILSAAYHGQAPTCRHLASSYPVCVDQCIARFFGLGGNFESSQNFFQQTFDKWKEYCSYEFILGAIEGNHEDAFSKALSTDVDLKFSSVDDILCTLGRYGRIGMSQKMLSDFCNNGYKDGHISKLCLSAATHDNMSLVEAVCETSDWHMEDMLTLYIKNCDIEKCDRIISCILRDPAKVEQYYSGDLIHNAFVYAVHHHNVSAEVLRHVFVESPLATFFSVEDECKYLAAKAVEFSKYDWIYLAIEWGYRDFWGLQALSLQHNHRGMWKVARRYILDDLLEEDDFSKLSTFLSPPRSYWMNQNKKCHI